MRYLTYLMLGLVTWACADISATDEALAVEEPVLIQMESVPATTIPAYNRDDWPTRWIDADSDCQDTRQEVLIEESQTEAELDSKGCRVVSGTWVDAYTGQVFFDPSELDIDHFIPLANVHRSGGWKWNTYDRQSYVNDLSSADTLIAVSASANRSKRDRGPDEWLPPNVAYRCTYAHLWLDVKERWGLTLTAAEARALVNLQTECP